MDSESLVNEAFPFAPRQTASVLFVGVVLFTGLFQATPLRERTDGIALDAVERIVRAVAPRQAVEDVVIVGIDEETERRFPEPFALWHRRLGDALSAIAHANPKAIALDLALPEQSYDELVPGLEADLLRGIVAA